MVVNSTTRRVAWILLSILTFLLCPASNASTITLPNVFTAGQTLPASQLNANFQTIYNDYNGGITNANINASAGIALSKLQLNAGSAAINARATGNNTWGSGITTDTQPRVTMTSDGWMLFGPGGSTAPDAYIWRSAAKTLQLVPVGGGTVILDMNSGEISGLSDMTATAATIDTLALTNPLDFASGGTTGATRQDAINALIGSGSAGMGVTNDGTNWVASYAQYFGDLSNARPAPTSGTLTGVYRTAANYATTGPITCNRCRLYFGGTVNIGHAITITAGVEGNAGGRGSTATYNTARDGQGPGGGAAAGPGSLSAGGGGGGGHGGNGGAPSESGTINNTYALDGPLAGSGGGGGLSNVGGGGTAGNAGDGGGGFYLESIGAVTIGANITAAGGNGSNGSAAAGTGGGGAGSGGGIDIRSLGNITVSGGVTVSANGGTGGAGTGGSNCPGGSGGGGGIVNFETPGTFTNSGTVQASAGNAGASVGAVTGNNGSAGVTNLGTIFTGPRRTF